MIIYPIRSGLQRGRWNLSYVKSNGFQGWMRVGVGSQWAHGTARARSASKFKSKQLVDSHLFLALESPEADGHEPLSEMVDNQGPKEVNKRPAKPNILSA